MNQRTLACIFIFFVSAFSGQASAQGRPPQQSTHPASQITYKIQVSGINAVQLQWWFSHLADKDGKHWQSLAPKNNQDISWIVDPREDSHHIVGAVFESNQKIPGGLFPGDNLHLQVQYADYMTVNRGPDGPPTMLPVIGLPRDYVPPHPTPAFFGFGPGAMVSSLTSADNGFNQDMLFYDGHGFAPGRMLWSWINTGDDDTVATAGKPRSVEIDLTIYLPWMEGGNRPPSMKEDGYFYNNAQTDAIWNVWKSMFEKMPEQLPVWFNKDTQDDLARAKGFAVTSVIDTGTVRGMTSAMEVWWWNHGMGDAPGNAYVFWAPSAHHTIRWLPGYSPAEVMKGKPVPTDHVVPGIVYPDLQHDNLRQDGGGMMSYPPAMSPIPGIYKTLNPMFIMSKEQVENFDKDRFPIPNRLLLHQWQDTPNGLIHRTGFVERLPLINPITQGGFIDDHQNFEGLYMSTGFVIKLYNEWLKKHPEDRPANIKKASAKK